MPRRARQLAETKLYHVMLRGVNRDAVFLEDEDRERFLHALLQAKTASGCLVLAYCLMTNHVHLVVQTPDEPISLVMKRLGVRYVGWFNRKYSRVGHLFESRFASLPVEDDAYLITLLRYVWNNPVKAGMVARAEDYPWSSRSPLGRDAGLLDRATLERLVPAEVLDGPLPGPDPAARFDGAKTGRPALYSEMDAGDLLRNACGATGPDDFGILDAGAQLRAIRELRTRSVPYAQLARITGWSATRLKRVQVAGLRVDEEPQADQKGTVPFWSAAPDPCAG
ncbi:MAG: transposase [Actinobacteria bacterium]|nr:transposase [Actinomycetota bacterium]